MHADLVAAQFLGSLDPDAVRDQEVVTVIEGDAREDEPQRGVAGEGPGGVARKDVDLARLQRGEPLLRRKRYPLHLLCVTEQRRRERAEEIGKIGRASCRERVCQYV